MTNINDVERIDLTIDGADEVDDNLQLVKGRGGALFREKMTELLTTKFIVIVDQTKRVSKLGEKCPIPVEVVRFGYLSTQRRLNQFGTPVLRSDPHDSEKPYYCFLMFIIVISPTMATIFWTWPLVRELRILPKWIVI